MTNGDINDFLFDLSCGFDLVFIFRGKKYFLEGYIDDNDKPTYFMWTLDPPAEDYSLILVGNGKHLPMDEFLALKIWDGKTFMEVQDEIQWVDD